LIVLFEKGPKVFCSFQKEPQKFFPFHGMGDTPKPHIVLSFGAKERTKESIHLSPTLPYMEGLKLGAAEAASPE